MSKNPPEEVLEQLWRVVDAARVATRLPDGVTQEEALEFLADQEKMLRRAICFFDASEANVRVGTKHPWIRTLEEERKHYLRTVVRSEES